MNFTTDRILHGGDYNPEQWLDYPEILEQDLRMLKKAKCNTVTLGVFSWSMLEPQEGKYDFAWLEKIIDRLWKEGIHVILATPSGARPKWLSDRYPQVLRCNEDGTRRFFGTRHNHCFTSPVYRAKSAAIDRELSRRFGRHPAVILWHISNELGGECFCPLCQDAFRGWLKERYGTIRELNRRWNTIFWSHVYDSFEQIEAPSGNGEDQLHALKLDWKRFVTHQTAEFMRTEIRAVREYSELPVTTNLMYYFRGLDYFRLAQEIDVVSWDTYPTWYKTRLSDTALDNGMCHDLMRSLKGKPFLQMESCPTSTNWQSVSRLKRPGLLTAQSLQAVAHGGDGAMYFQIRQSAGAAEKFHGAVIDHYGGEDTRVFREVCETGSLLEKLGQIAGTQMITEAVMLYDWDSIWAMEDSQGPRNTDLHYRDLLAHFYKALRRCGIGVDLKDENSLIQPDGLKHCRLLIIPMGYMFKEGFDRAVEEFVGRGGTVITTFWSGIADETDLCYLGAVPHGLTQVLGVRSTEIDGLYDWESNTLTPPQEAEENIPEDPNSKEGTPSAALQPADRTDAAPGEDAVSRKSYSCRYLCDLPSPIRECDEKLHTLLVYGEDFYAGMSALTRCSYGKGEAWYLAAHAQEPLYEDLILEIALRQGLGLAGKERSGLLPEGLEVTERTDGKNIYRFYQNFSGGTLDVPNPGEEWQMIAADAFEGPLQEAAASHNVQNETDPEEGKRFHLPEYGFLICRKAVDA